MQNVDTSQTQQPDFSQNPEITAAQPNIWERIKNNKDLKRTDAEQLPIEVWIENINSLKA